MIPKSRLIRSSRSPHTLHSAPPRERKPQPRHTVRPTDRTGPLRLLSVCDTTRDESFLGKPSAGCRTFDLFCREFTGLRVNETSYRISSFYYYDLILPFKKVFSQTPIGTWEKDAQSK